MSKWRRVHSCLGRAATWAHSCQEGPGLSHAAAPAGLCFSIFANNLPKPEFIFACRFRGGLSPLSGVSPPVARAVPAFMTTFSQAASPVLLSSWTAFVGKTQRNMGTFSHAGWAPCPSSFCWAGAFPGLWLQRAGEGAGTAGQHLLSLVCASRCPRKQRENRECSSQKLKLVRVTSTVQELEFPFSWGIPQFCNGLLFFAGAKPESFGISNKTKLGKDK